MSEIDLIQNEINQFSNNTKPIEKRIFFLKDKFGNILGNRVIKIDLARVDEFSSNHFTLFTKSSKYGELAIYANFDTKTLELFPEGVEIENTDKSESQILTFKITDNNEIIVNI